MRKRIAALAAMAARHLEFAGHMRMKMKLLAAAAASAALLIPAA